MPERKHILCIEDDRDTAWVIAEELTDRGFHVSLAYDGEQGFQFIRDVQPDLVLADVSMPVLSGFDLLERLLDPGCAVARLPFLYLTALSDRANELRGRRLGADDYITKPIDFDILAITIANRLGRPAPDGPRANEISDREAEVLTWAARGKTSSEIGQILGLSKRTVDFHIDSARLKLGATTRMHAAVLAIGGQLIDPYGSGPAFSRR